MVKAIMKIEGFDTIEIELFTDVKNSANNFISLANSGFYDGLTMHRIIPGFVAQGGCPEGSGMGGPGYTIDGEFSANGYDNPHKHEKGAISWARSMARNSAGSQFYLTLDSVPHLDGEYAVFGKVIKNLNVLEEIAKFGTGNGTPTKVIKIESVTIELGDYVLEDVIKV